jgi:hypothetical protein
MSPVDNGIASQDDTSLPLDAYGADDFMFDEDTEVTDVHWIGTRYKGPQDFCIEFYEDFCGIEPGASFAGPFCFEDWQVIKIPRPGGWWEFRVDLPTGVEFDAGVKYWISIWGDFDFLPGGWQFFWGIHYDPPTPVKLSEAVFKSAFFGMPDWVSASCWFGISYDHCFQLTALPNHDVGVIDIVSPNECTGFMCGCLPVIVKVANMGKFDETDVPVWVQIRRYQFKDGFEAGGVWSPEGPAFAFEITGTDSGNPSVVTPYKGFNMLEFKSGNGFIGHYNIWTLAPESFVDKCKPVLRFFMWHDNLGSDDYIEVLINDGMTTHTVGPQFQRICCPGCDEGWIEHTVDLSAFVGEPFIWVGFHGYADGNPTAYNLHIDEVATFDNEFYAETTVDIGVGEEKDVEFDECWTPCQWQDAISNKKVVYEIESCTELDTDQVPINDCRKEILVLHFPFLYDVAAIAVDEPEPVGDCPEYKLCGTIKNVGQFEMCCFKAKMTVSEIGSPFSIWLDTQQGNGYTVPPGWTKGYQYTWYWSTWSNYISLPGVTAPNGRMYWYYPYAGYSSDLTSPKVNTAMASLLELKFAHEVNHYSASYPYQLNIDIRPDIVQIG